MIAQSFTLDNRLMLALSTTAQTMTPGNRFKERNSSIIYVAYKIEAGMLLAKRLHGKGTASFKINHPLMIVI